MPDIKNTMLYNALQEDKTIGILYMEENFSEIEKKVCTKTSLVITKEDTIGDVVRKIYTNPSVEDKHQVFANYLKTSRQEAKALSYVYLYSPHLWKES